MVSEEIANPTTDRYGNGVSEVAGLLSGIDIVQMSWFGRAVKVGGERFVRRILTDRESKFCRGRVERMAVRFAAKEAIAKALGTGIRGISWREMEIVSARNGQPAVVLRGRALERARKLNIAEWTVSLSHGETLVIAIAIGIRRRAPRVNWKRRRKEGTPWEG